ncbi:hypothetical protein DFJ74DRAFT_681802 [Hyaloraphidium curvatum]|nr:hypothetical protein DFJ74DRAFT_681802 [Hyaloraphidium curvatum]
MGAGRCVAAGRLPPLAALCVVFLLVFALAGRVGGGGAPGSASPHPPATDGAATPGRGRGTLPRPHLVRRLFPIPQPGGSPTAAYVANALRNQRELGSSVPMDRVGVPAVNASTSWFDGNYSSPRVANASLLLVAGYRRVYLDLYRDPRTGSWQLCPFALPLPATRTTLATTSAPTRSRTTSASALSGNASLATSSVSLAGPTTGAIAASALPGTTTAIARGARQLTQTLSASTSAVTGTRTGSLSTSISASSLTSVAPLTTTLRPTASPTPPPNEITVNGTTCSIDADSLPLFLSSIQTYLTNTVVPFYRDVIYLIFSLHDAALLPGDDPTVAVPPVPLHIALGLTAGDNALGAQLFTPSDLAVERDDLNLTFGTSPYFVTAQQGPLEVTANGWPTLGFILNALNKRLVVGLASLDAPAGYDWDRDSTWLFSPEQINASVPLDFSNTGEGTFGSCTYPAPSIVMGPTGNETGAPPPTVPPGATELTWSYAFFGETGFPPGVNYTGWFNPVRCGFSPLAVDNATSPDVLVGSIWSWDVNMPANGSLANCAVQQRANGRWTIDSCTSTHPVACQSLYNPEVWTVSTASGTYTSALAACPSGYFFSVPRTARENDALWQAFLAVPASAEPTAVFLDYTSLAHQGCWTAGGPNSLCAYVDRQAIITQIIQTSFQEGIIVLVLFIIFVWFQCRNQVRNVQKRKRRAEVKRQLAALEIATVPA